MPPKVDPNEVRFSTDSLIELTSKYSVENPVPLPPSLPSLVPSVWYIENNAERQESWWGHRQGRNQVERYPSDGSIEMPKQSCRNHRQPKLISPPYQGARKLRERQKESQHRDPQGQPHIRADQENRQGPWRKIYVKEFPRYRQASPRNLSLTRMHCR